MTFYKPDTLKSTAICALAALAFTTTPALADHHKEGQPKPSMQDKMKDKDKMMSDEERMEMMEEREETRIEMMEEGEEARMEMMEERERVRIEMRGERAMTDTMQPSTMSSETEVNGYVFSEPVRAKLLAGGLTEAQIDEREARMRAQFEQMARLGTTAVRPMPEADIMNSPSTMTTSSTTTDTSTDMSSGTTTTTTVETTTSMTVACPEGTVAQSDGTCMMTD